MDTSAAADAIRRQARRGRIKTQAACTRCRQLRTKCDAARPSCGSCIARGSTCEYDTIDPSESRFGALRRNNVSLQEEVAQMATRMDWLKSLSTQDAFAWLQLLRSAQTPEELRQTLNWGSLGGAQATQTISPRQAMSAGLPTHRSLAGLELAEETSTSFPLIDPEQHSDLLDDLWRESIGENSTVKGSGHAETTPPTSVEMSRQSTTSKTSYGPPARFGPGPKFAFHDSRLRALEIDHWTTVPISNQSAAMIMSLYLQHEHDGFGFFDPDLFVDDLVNKRDKFCSSLLVNSLMSWACRTYSFVDAGSDSLASLFFDTAQKSWRTGERSDGVLNVASLAILGLGGNGGGHPLLAATLLIECVQMGERIGLFGDHRLPAEAFGFVSDDDASQYAWIAWGAFNLSTVETWYFRGKSIGMLTTRPPLLPIPHRRNDSGRYHRYADHEPHIMPAYCRLWTILNEMLVVYHDDHAPILERVPLAFAESKFAQLMGWCRALPQALVRRADMPSMVAMLHIVFHAIITDVFRPFRQLFVQSLGFQFRYRVGDIFDCSSAQLRSLSLDFHHRFKSTPATHSVSWITAILWGANSAIAGDRENRQANIVFYTQASANLLKSHPVMDRFVRGLLSMAVSAGILSLSQARQVLRQLKRTITSSALGLAGWVTDLNLAMEDPKSAVADVLAQRFDEMSGEEEQEASA